MTIATASPIPAVFQAGMGQDMVWQPLYESGNGNPAFYHQWFDDFDEPYRLVSGNAYTLTGTSATFVAASGGGGLATLSTQAVANSIAQIQLGDGTHAGFMQNIAPKKLFWEMRINNDSNAVNSTWVLGLCNVGAAIAVGTGLSQVNSGVYFYYAGASNTLTINTISSAVLTSATIPTGSYTLPGTSFDIAFAINRLGDIQAFVDTQLVGYIPQSMIGNTGAPKNAGCTARIPGGSYIATSTNLTPTVCVWTSNGTSSAMTLDFLTVQQER